jgi:hypothetical protein
MKNIISFDGFADVANNLINKLSHAIGWFFTRETPEKQAISTYIEEIKNSNKSPLIKAALISEAKKTIKEYRNQNNIVDYAIQSLSPESQPENIDEDWLSLFMDKARLISNPEFQIVWGRILAGECDTPGSTPKSLLHTLELLDKKTAEKFMAIASVSVWYLENSKKVWMPIVLGNAMEYYKSIGITHDDIWELTTLGLTKDDFGFASAFAVEFDKPNEIHYHDQTYTINSVCDISFGNVLFTEAGQALCSSVDTEKIEGFFEKYCVPHFDQTKKDTNDKSELINI